MHLMPPPHTRTAKPALDSLLPLKRHIEQSGLTLNALCVLTVIEKGEIGPADLSRKLGITTAAVTGLVDGLVAKGHVGYRAVPGDRRKKMLSLTPDGSRIVTDAAHFYASQLLAA